MIERHLHDGRDPHAIEPHWLPHWLHPDGEHERIKEGVTAEQFFQAFAIIVRNDEAVAYLKSMNRDLSRPTGSPRTLGETTRILFYGLFCSAVAGCRRSMDDMPLRRNERSWATHIVYCAFELKVPKGQIAEAIRSYLPLKMFPEARREYVKKEMNETMRMKGLEAVYL